MFKRCKLNNDQFSYRMIKNSFWGICIDIKFEITSMSSYENKNSCKEISKGLWARVLDIGLENEEEFIWKGLTLISKSIISKSPYNDDTLILFHNIDYNPCDYQSEGLTDATMQLIAHLLDIDVPKAEITFNRNLNKYEFKYEE